MRLLFGAVAVAATATLVGACAAIAGLNPYSVGECPAEGCDASVRTAPPDGTTDNDGGSPNPGDDGPSTEGGGCGAGQTCDGGCANDCPSSVAGGCVDYAVDNANCGGCGAACASGQTCIDGTCVSEDGGTEPGTDASVACPDGGCPSSAATGFSCPFGSCNGSSSECTNPGGCFCSNDTQCLSGKCVKVTGENDVSCGSHCSGSGGRDGFDCELASPGIPALTGAGYACPADSGFKNTTLTCDPTHTNCYCNADSQCPNGKCVPSTNNANCSPGGPCSGSGTADFRGCVTIASVGGCPIYIGCPANSTCSYPNCYCTSDVACESGHCIPSSHNNNCSGCTGKGTDDGHGCQPPPSSVACAGSGGSACTTTLTPAPVLNSGHTACLCVADSNCSSGKCVNTDSVCSGSCTGSAPADDENCRTATSIANAWSCSLGNCSTVTSPTGTCAAAGVPCWCTSDTQCPSGSQCATWAGCPTGACSGAGTGNAFHCVVP
jgi:hypothetical protein